MEITIHSVVNTHYLMEQIVSKLTRDQLVQLIKYIDDELVQDEDFTNELYLYFKAKDEYVDYEYGESET